MVIAPGNLDKDLRAALEDISFAIGQTYDYAEVIQSAFVTCDDFLKLEPDIMMLLNMSNAALSAMISVMISMKYSILVFLSVTLKLSRLLI